LEPNHHAPCRKLLGPDSTTHIPHEEADIEVIRCQPAADPACAPVAHHHDEWPELTPGGSQVILPAMAGWCRPTLNHAFYLEPFQPLRQQRRRHQRHAASKIVEVRAAGDELPQNQWGPPFSEDLRRLGDRAVLSIALHDLEDTAPPGCHLVQIS